MQDRIRQNRINDDMIVFTRIKWDVRGQDRTLWDKIKSKRIGYMRMIMDTKGLVWIHEDDHGYKRTG